MAPTRWAMTVEPMPLLGPVLDVWRRRFRGTDRAAPGRSNTPSGRNGIRRITGTASIGVMSMIRFCGGCLVSTTESTTPTLVESSLRSLWIG